jgi:hypothetical protein
MAPRRPIHVIQPVADRLGEGLELADDHRQGCPEIGRVDRGFPLLLQGPDPLPEARHAGLEVLLLDDAVGVAVDQASHTAAQGCQPAVDRGHRLLARARILDTLEAPMVFGLDPFRLLQKACDLPPDHLIQPIHPHLPVPAQPLATEAVTVVSEAAVIRVGGAPRAQELPVDRLGIVGVAAFPADQQPLQQVTFAAGPGPAEALVLGQLVLHHLEQVGVDDGRDGNGDPMLRRPLLDPVRLTAMFAATPRGAQARRGRRGSDTPPPEGRAPDVGRVPEHRPDRRAAPGGCTVAGEIPGLVEPAAHRARAQPVVADPLEDQPDNLGLLLDDLVPGDPATVALADVAVAVGRTGQGADRALLGGMALAPPAALEDLGPLVFRDHALYLQEQVVFCRRADRPVEEDDLGPGPPELFHEDDLVGIAPGQAVRRMDVEAVHQAGGDRVAQALQRGAQQGIAAVAVIDEAMLRQGADAVLDKAGIEGGELACDG